MVVPERPACLQELLGQERVLELLSPYLKQNRPPHLVLYGPAGTGKTTLARLLTQHLWPDARERRSRVLSLNASRERTLSLVRERIVPFMRTGLPTRTPRNFKVVVLDESDALRRDTQLALRKVLEQPVTSVCPTVFWFLGNYLFKLNPALLSRCLVLPFSPLSDSHLTTLVRRHVPPEAGDQAAAQVVECSRGDARVAVRVARDSARLNLSPHVLCGWVPWDTVKALVALEREAADRRLRELLDWEGYSSQILLYQLVRVWTAAPLTLSACRQVAAAGLAEWGLRLGADPYVQLRGVLHADLDV